MAEKPAGMPEYAWKKEQERLAREKVAAAAAEPELPPSPPPEPELPPPPPPLAEERDRKSVV